MSIHKTPSGTWRVYYREGDRQRSKNFPTRADAERFDTNVKTRKIEGRPVTRRKDAPTLREFTLQWLKGRRDELAPATLEGYAAVLERHVLSEDSILHGLRLHGSDLRPSVMDEWQRERLDAGAGRNAVRKAHTVLSQILDAAVLRTDFLEANPLAPVKSPKIRKPEPRYLTAVEVERLRRALIDAKDTGSATLVSVLAYVGIRPQDALALEWDHVGTGLQVIQKNADGKILPGSKTGTTHRRTVNLPDPVAADLESWRVESGSRHHGLIFPRVDDGRPWRSHDYRNWRRRAFDRAAKIAGIGHVNPYALRHTCASLSAAAGWNHLEIARQLGHSAEMSVRTYQHLIPIGFGERRPIDEWITEARNHVAVAEMLPQD